MTKYNYDNTTIASYRVFETLKFLIKQPANVTDIIKYLESLNIGNGNSYSKGVIYKYIATLKFAGIDIGKQKCKYVIKNLPFKIPFNEDNIHTIALIDNIIEKLPEKNLTKNIKELIYSLKIRSSADNKYFENIKQNLPQIKLGIPTDKQLKILEKYEKYCNDNLKLCIEYKDIYGQKCKINCEPTETKFENNQIYLYCYCELLNEFIQINSKQILNITQTPLKCSTLKKQSLAKSTVYTISGKLVKRYKPRNSEIYNQNTDETITIINKEEAKNKLNMRLMRYGICCEINSPKTERHRIREMIAKTLSNYNIDV